MKDLSPPTLLFRSVVLVSICCQTFFQVMCIKSYKFYYFYPSIFIKIKSVYTTKYYTNNMCDFQKSIVFENTSNASDF